MLDLDWKDILHHFFPPLFLPPLLSLPSLNHPVAVGAVAHGHRARASSSSSGNINMRARATVNSVVVIPDTFPSRGSYERFAFIALASLMPPTPLMHSTLHPNLLTTYNLWVYQKNRAAML